MNGSYNTILVLGGLNALSCSVENDSDSGVTTEGRENYFDYNDPRIHQYGIGSVYSGQIGILSEPALCKDYDQLPHQYGIGFASHIAKELVLYMQNDNMLVVNFSDIDDKFSIWDEDKISDLEESMSSIIHDSITDNENILDAVFWYVGSHEVRNGIDGSVNDFVTNIFNTVVAISNGLRNVNNDNRFIPISLIIPSIEFINQYGGAENEFLQAIKLLSDKSNISVLNTGGNYHSNGVNEEFNKQSMRRLGRNLAHDYYLVGRNISEYQLQELPIDETPVTIEWTAHKRNYIVFNFDWGSINKDDITKIQVTFGVLPTYIFPSAPDDDMLAFYRHFTSNTTYRAYVIIYRGDRTTTLPNFLITVGDWSSGNEPPKLECENPGRTCNPTIVAKTPRLAAMLK